MTSNYRTDGKFRIEEERRLLDNRRLPAYTSNTGTEHHKPAPALCVCVVPRQASVDEPSLARKLRPLIDSG
jgi:hypothetical protein